jgi:hypothetical protein
MRLTAITDAILKEAVRAQPTDEFDSHDVIFWISRNHPRPYAQDLYLGLQDENDPFVSLHTAIGRRLAALVDIVRQQHRKRRSPNVRGEVDECEVWRRMVAPPAGEGLSPEVQALREVLLAAARERRFVSYTEAAATLGLRGAKPWRSPRLFAALDEISTFEHREGRPLLSAVVVSSVGKRPGGGFFKMAKRNGVQGSDEDNKIFFIAERDRVWDYWTGRAASGT